jgi:hypothetical protein
MRKRAAVRLALVIFMLLFGACKSSPPNSPASSTKPPTECECVEYPFPQDCDAKCGMMEFIVKGVDQNNKTVEVASANQPSEERTIPLSGLQASQIPVLQPGAHIQVLFKKTEGTQSVIKPLRLNLLREPHPK